MQTGSKALKAIANANSTMIFRVPSDCIDCPLDLRSILPARQIAMRGKVADTERNTSQHGEGKVEFFGLRVLVAMAHYEYLKFQPLLLKFKNGGKPGKYWADALIVRGNRKMVVEFKVNRQAEKKKEYFQLIRALLAEHGFQFTLWRESQIMRNPRLHHVGKILSYRRVEVPDIERERVRRAFADASQMTIKQLSTISRTSPQAICHLVFEGMLHIDWWADSLDLTSLVSTVPIGEQVWPAPDAPLLEV